MAAQAYFIQCITNLHVGSGDATYGIIDKLVQRDTVLGYPTIHASSLKGALRERFETLWKDKEAQVVHIFGRKTAKDADAESGNCNFLNADLIALPVRCSHNQFALTLSSRSIQFVNDKAKMLVGREFLEDPTNANKLFTTDNIAASEIFLEDDNIEKANFHIFKKSVFVKDFDSLSKQYAVVDEARFDNYTSNLPVIARNRLDDNRNLWYEEIVPHQTVFITYFIPSTTMDTQVFEDFERTLGENLFQIGGNSSVGYGLCKFHKVTLSQNQNRK